MKNSRFVQKIMAALLTMSWPADPIGEAQCGLILIRIR